MSQAPMVWWIEMVRMVRPGGQFVVSSPAGGMDGGMVVHRRGSGAEVWRCGGKSPTGKAQVRVAGAATRMAVRMATPGTDPPPYTKLSTPVYSLSTEPSTSDSGLRPTMNITTYCSPVAIHPKRCYALGLYNGTLSRENMLATGKGVLQVPW
eukprot:evm.model.scf_483.5 EVM.evm.TU.scf_483.5   scf_483:77184-78741(-)